jgi:uncharacterized protein YjbI with pentapeptide repeats
LAENTQTHVLVSAIERAIGQDDPYVEGLQASWEELGFDADLRLFEFHDVWLDHCVLRELHARKASFYECTLTNCDLSGADLREAYFARTRLVGCKLEGTQLPQSFWRSSRLEDCMCRYANFGEVTWEGTRLVRCDMRESFLSEMRLRAKTSFDECDLTRADLFRTPLRGVDLSSCNIAGISVSDTREELRGLVIGVEQAQDLVGMLGVRMVDV